VGVSILSNYRMRLTIPPMSTFLPTLFIFGSSTKTQGVATYIQHYCWGTQQTVKWRNCPLAILLPEEDFFRKFSGRRICDFRKYPENTFGRTSSGMFPEEDSSGNFRKKVLPEVSFFEKNILFCNNLLLMDKLNYKIINIIIHK